MLICLNTATGHCRVYKREPRYSQFKSQEASSGKFSRLSGKTGHNPYPVGVASKWKGTGGGGGGDLAVIL